MEISVSLYQHKGVPSRKIWGYIGYTQQGVTETYTFWGAIIGGGLNQKVASATMHRVAMKKLGDGYDKIADFDFEVDDHAPGVSSIPRQIWEVMRLVPYHDAADQIVKVRQRIATIARQSAKKAVAQPTDQLDEPNNLVRLNEIARSSQGFLSDFGW
ncbi:hypothetical protein [Acidithiobacillus ferriphilus]|uniref:hypothetical protein n=1 Tax=Acidithiobacillus ferriphilus TaxID=1689834 RepID=UPI002DB7A8BE|nr:hypothetical protein [Acidithiobacillus ferriphilus]MEB8476714.1 hypothetical protein [Acidithiobacillus ferriphilus]